jgi:TolB-like protein/DNA-binding winged helix-turn-helix (wHTH) protein/Flp pilus assembly protein TadD
MPSSASLTVVEFGVFELDLQRAELRKNGVRVRLQEQPLKILQVLLESPGQIVAREELQKRIWPANTFVEFDQGLYSAMARLRDALGDSSDNPRFIETVARRGYRFIAPVTVPAAALIAGVGSDDQAKVKAGKALTLRRLTANLLAGLVGGALLLAIVLTFDIAGAREWLRNRTTPIRSIAVLPLENLSGDPAQEYFADGMTDELITTLARLGNVRVVSRTSVMRFKKTAKPVAQVGKELNVDGVVEGTVERSGNRVRIRVQLIQASSDRHLWAQTYDREVRDTLLLQSEAARDIAQEIESKLTSVQQQRLAAARRVDPEAYEAYLKGLYFSNKRSAPNFERAIRYFEDAIARDPNYAAAYSGLSDALLGEIFTGTPQEKVRERLTWAALKAIELDPLSPEAHNSLGGVREMFDWNWSGAENEYRRAIELNPNFAAGHQDYALFLAFMGRFDQAIAEAQQSQELDPLSPFVRTTYCLDLSVARRFSQAVEKCQQALELDPNFLHAHGNLMGIYISMGQYDHALEEFEKAGDPPAQIAAARQAYLRAGINGFLRQLLKMTRQSGSGDGDGIDLASLYSRLGETDQAFASMQKAYRERSPQMEFVKEHSDFDNLRSDPRYAEFLRRVGLQQ